MSRAARNRRGRIQPYAWLGAGAVTLGLGMGVVSGTAVAFADTGADTGPAADTATTSAAANSGPTRASSPAKKAATRGRGPTTGDTDVSAAGAAQSERAESRVTLPAAAVAVAVAEPATGSDTTADTTADPRTTATRRAPRVETPAVTAAKPSAVVALPAADPAPNMESWLPDTPIVPGARVELALEQMAIAGQVLQAQTWGTGNVLAGLASIVPQIFLTGGALSLSAWQATNPGAQQFLASTAGIPLIHQVAQTNLIVNTWLTNISQVSLAGAELFLPIVGLLGGQSAVAATAPIIAAARQNGTVYAIVPVQIKATTQPVASVSINGGRGVPLLIDTGASGVVVLPTAVPNLEALTPVGAGDSCFSGGLCYHYETYETTIDFGGGAVTDTGLVNVVTNNDEYPDSVADFADFFSWGADGILGVGANTAGPGPAPIANATLPGELSNGVLLLQGLLPIGLGGVMVFGPNPLPTRVSLPGAPDAFVKVSVNGEPLTDAGAIIDSGGVYGTLALANAPAGSTVGQNVQPGTVIRVYATDGTTLLYTYTAQAGLFGTPVIASGLINTGNAPFAQNPIYMNYASFPESGIGSTDFSIW
ncbi:MAG: hypothetical protein FGM50_12115 [Mycobacterium sp.]|nr:hypothetical protein [Mycobacterium sp.]